MDTSPFGFRIAPFAQGDCPTPYVNAQRQAVHTGVLASLHERQGLVILTGASGTGKSLLLRQLAHSLGEATHLVAVHDGVQTFVELLERCCQQLFLPVPAEDSFSQVRAINDFLEQQAQRDALVVLLLDDAHHLSKEILARFRLLLNPTIAGRTLLQIVLAGQPSLEDLLTHQDLIHIHQRVASWQRLTPLAMEEVSAFIHHQLQIAGSDRHDLFTTEAVQTIAQYSQAIPRRINLLCEKALALAHTTGQRVISAATVEIAARDLALTERPSLRDQEGDLATPALATFAAPAVKTAGSYAPRWSRYAVGASAGVLFVWLTLQNAPLRSPNHQLAEPEQLVQLEPSPASDPAVTKQQPALLGSTAQPMSSSLPAPVQVAVSPPLAPAMGLADTPKRPTRKDRASVPASSASTARQEQHSAARAELARLGIPANETALLTHVEEGNAPVVELLLAAGVSANAKDKQGWTPLMLAVRDNDDAIVGLLFTHGANIKAKNAAGGTALIVAAMNGQAALVRTLLERGAQINVANRQGWTALMYAAWKGHTTTVETLLNSGANTALKDKDGWTALQYAAWQSANVERVAAEAPETPPTAPTEAYGAIAALLQHAMSKKS